MLQILRSVALIVATGQAAQPALITVVIETSAGVIEVAIDPVHAPITAANFLRYVDPRNAEAPFDRWVAGDEKAEAVRRAIEGAPAGLEVPARRVDPPGGKVVWLLDRLSATRLAPKS